MKGDGYPMGTHRVSHREKNHHGAFQKMECPCMETFCFLRCCRNPSLGLVTKARAYKGAGQERSWESHLMLPGV